MAAKRISKTAVDWAAFAERIPSAQKDAFRRFKGVNDKFQTRVNQYSEEMHKIDFSFYKSKLADPKLAAEFEKAYAAVKVPYPTDVNNWKAQIEDMEKKADSMLKQEAVDAKQSLVIINDYMKAIDTLPQWKEMTKEMMTRYFPQSKIDFTKKPMHWPYIEKDQTDAPGNHMMNYFGAPNNPLAPKPKKIE